MDLRIPSLCTSVFSLTRQLAVQTPGAVMRTKQVSECEVFHTDPKHRCYESGALNWPSLPGLCFLFFCFLKKYDFQRLFWRLDYMQNRSAGLSLQFIPSAQFHEYLRAIIVLQVHSQGQHRPCVLIFHSALCFDRFTNFCFELFLLRE